MEDFKPLALFLFNTRQQLLSELLQVDFKKETAKIEAAILTSQLNLLGTIAELPKMLKNLKDQFEEIEQRNEKIKAASADPLHKGEY